MYLDYFGLAETPFSITPDPTFIYLSQRHREALAHLLYGVGQGGSGGFVQLTGEVGTGKTTLCRALLDQVPDGVHVALVLNPLMTPKEMLAAICEELGIDTAGAESSSKALVDRLNHFLLWVHDNGGRVVVVIDEAQNLSPESLEQIRLLTNLETRKDKLLQIILLGQPELRELLRRRNLRQLAQRVTARYHLTPLGREDTARYVAHRLEVAGARHNLFTRSGLTALFQRSRGVPRLINIIADRALAGAYARERGSVDARLVNAAADEVQLGEPGVDARWWPRVAVAAVLAGLVGIAVWQLWPEPRSADAVADAPSETQTRPEPEPAEVPEFATVNDEWLNNQSLQAWPALATAWGRPGDAALIEAACRGAEGLGYACVRDQGTLPRIRQLGLPVVLALAGNGGRQLLLSGIDGDRLMVGGDGTLVRRDDIEPLWFGDFLVAWPQSAGWPKQLARGDSGEAVATVLQMAGRADVPYEGAEEFGPAFERWLTDFQRRHGLEPDGIVGPRTLLYLMRFSIEEPSLATSLETGV